MPDIRPDEWERRFARRFFDPVGFYEVIWKRHCPGYMAEWLRIKASDFDVSAAPGTLKTTAIAARAMYDCIVRPYLDHHPHRVLITAPLESNLALDWQEIEERIMDVPLLKELLGVGVSARTGIQRAPTWRILWHNASTIDFRISGTDGKPLRGIHVHHIYVDEAEGFPMAAEAILATRRLKGGNMGVLGMVDGVRETLLYARHEDPTSVHFTATAYESPNWDDVERSRAEKRWGVGSAEWMWYIEARWDHQSESVWNLEDIAKMTRRQPYQPIKVTVEQYRQDYGSNVDAALGHLPEVTPNKTVIVAADIGETASPTNIGVFTLDHQSTGAIMQDRLEYRLALDRWEAYERSQAFDYLARRYRVHKMAIDQGAAGSAVISNLLNPTLFPGRVYQNVVVPVDFRKQIEMVRIEDETANVVLEQHPFRREPAKPETVSHMAKHATTRMLRERFFRQQLSIPNDSEMWDEFSKQRLVEGRRYTDPQHTIDMLRCYAYARHMMERDELDGVDANLQRAPELMPVWA